MATKKYICSVCGYVHEGASASDACPVCKAPASEFKEVKKKGLFSDKNSNAYILLYSTVMVVVVAAVLAVASLSLQKRQAENILMEKKQAIMTALNEPDKNYDDYITAYAVDADGVKIPDVNVFDKMKTPRDLKESLAAGIHPVFESKDGRFVIPVVGQGLWDAIWGYVALDSDMNTISGIVLDHKGETPGLGAEIATPKHQAEYVGKIIFEGDKFVSVSLKKGGAKPDDANYSHEVDAISGGTKTSDGVTAMLYNSIEGYVPFFKARKAAEAAAAPAVSAADAAAEVSNNEKVESNE